MKWAVLLLAGVIPQDDSRIDSVAVIELNRFYDEVDTLVLTQYIYWDWSAVDGQLHVVDWRYAKRKKMRPEFDYERKLWSATWIDRDGRPRTVEARMFRETDTYLDPEHVDRLKLPQEKRRLLSR